MIRTALSAFVLAALTPAVLADTEPAQDAATIGPVVGTEAPVFSAVASDGTSVDLAAISGSSGAVLVLSRSLDWCPYCKKQAIELKEAAAPLSEAGWELNLLTYDSPGILADFSAEEELNYTLLSDEGSVMIDALGLRNPDMPKGTRFDGVPHPAILFISNDGIVRAFMREEGYKDRPPVESVTEAAALLNQTGLIQ